MYRSSRQVHRWVGFTLALFLALIAGTGFLLANKKRVAWLQPPPADGLSIAAAAEIITIEAALGSVYALGDHRIQKLSDVDRVDYRPKDNIFKIISNDGYLEVQVDGKSGAVLSTSFRNDQLMEDIHDFSFFADWAHTFLLPVVAIGLTVLAFSGIGLFLTPVVRRWQFKRSGGVIKQKPK